MAKSTRNRLSIIAAVVVPVLGAAFFLFCRVGVWLAVADPVPSHLDVIFTFGGENARVAYSRELMDRYPQARWVLSDYFHRYSRILSRDNFDMSRVAIVDTCRYTLAEVKGLGDWLRRHGRQSAPVPPVSDDAASPARQTILPLRVALVSSPFHMRRIKSITTHAFPNSSYMFYYLPVPLERYGWTQHDVTWWWRTRAIRTWVGSEIGKLLAYWTLFSWN